MTILMSVKPVLSVVLTSYRYQKLDDISKLLRSLKDQTCERLETVYIVEQSLPLFEWITNQVKKDNVPHVKVFFSWDRLGLAQARNLGVRESSGNIIAFIDDDVLLPANWAEEMVKAYDSDESIIGVTGPASPIWEDESQSWLPKEFYWLISCTNWSKLNGITEVRSAWGMNMSFRREAFTNHRFFDPDGSGYHKPIAEDLDFSLRLTRETGKRIVYSSNVKVMHRVYAYRLTWKFIAKRSHHIGTSRYIIRRYYKNAQTNLFDREYSLLKSVLINFFINSFGTLPKAPRVFANRISVCFICFTFIIIGFISGPILVDSQNSQNDKIRQKRRN